MLTQKWLERTPGLEEDGFNFQDKFRQAVEAVLQRDMDEIEGSVVLTSLSR